MLDEKLKALIGYKTGGKLEVVEVKIGSKMSPFKVMKFPESALDLLEEKIKELNPTYEKIRFKYHGGVYTQDFVQSRLNVRIDGNGIVSEIYFG